MAVAASVPACLGGVGVAGGGIIWQGGAGDWALVPDLPQMDIVGQLFKVLTCSQPERSTWREGGGLYELLRPAKKTLLRTSEPS